MIILFKIKSWKPKHKYVLKEICTWSLRDRKNSVLPDVKQRLYFIDQIGRYNF